MTRLVCLAAALGVFSFGAFAQSNSGTIQGVISDPSQAVVPGATVTIQNPVSHFSATITTDNSGAFAFTNVPYNNYHLTVSKPGFQTGEQDVNLRSGVPIDVKIALKLGTANQTIEVTTSREDLLENIPVTHTDVDRGLFDKVPLESGSSSLSSLVTLSAPGVAADSNGLFHGMGDHAENSFSVDGQPITDQQSKIFSNQLPLDAVQSLEVIQGAPPPEFGDKTSLVIVVTTRSGLGVKQPHGEATASYGSFGTANLGFNLSTGNDKWGNFISASGLTSGRFLDPPEFSVMHDKGNLTNLWDRIDYKPNSADTFNLNLGFTRSWFQTPNSFDGQLATAWTGVVVDNKGLGPDGKPVGSSDQRAKIDTINIAPTWTHLFSPTTVLTIGGFFRRDQFIYYPSRDPFADFTPNLQSEGIGQSRRLSNSGFHADVSHVKGIHNMKVGVLFEHTGLTETDVLSIVDPTLNAPCLLADGVTPVTAPGVTDTNNCAGTTQSNPAFDPVLACVDLTRTGTLPASNGCPAAHAAPYTFRGNGVVTQTAVFFQDSVTIKNWNFNYGARFDAYHGFANMNEIEPRGGIAYNIKPTGTVLRVSYARTMETPFNENQVLASHGCSDPLVGELLTVLQGYPCLDVPEKPGRRDEYHAGIQQAFGKYLVIDGEYIWKYTHRAYDFSILGSTPITFPIEWYSSKIPGYAVRASMPNFHGLTAYVAFSSVAARFFTPQVAGLGSTPTSTGTSTVFRIDHDEVFNQTTHLQFQPRKNGPWIGFNWRYDSGLVAGPVPCAGGNCNNGPNGTDSIVDVSGLSPDQQFQAGLFCGSVHATPLTPISATGFCPAAQYGSTLIKVPAPGKEDDDHNPPRIGSRNLFDLAIGHDNIFHGDRYKWSARVAVVNLLNNYALYNFLSTFSGTHYVTPRTVTATVGFHF